MKRLPFRPSRRFLKWTGLAVSACTSGLWVGSLVASVGYVRCSPDLLWSVGLGEGRVGFVRQKHEGVTLLVEPQGWRAEVGLPRLVLWKPDLRFSSGNIIAIVPVWIPLILLAAPTAWL